MSNFRQAPKLYHSEEKSKKGFYMLPQSLMDCVFNQLNGRQGNQIKVMIALLGTAGDGSFAVSEKWICDRTGMDQPSYNRARKALINMGWLKLENGRLYVDFEAIRNTGKVNATTHAEDMLSGEMACDEHIEKTCDDDMYNKEKQINNNKKEIYNGKSSYVADWVDELKESKVANIPEDVQKQLKEIGIDFKANSVATLEELIGEKLNYNILRELLIRYRADFARAKGKPESYIFGILKKKVQTDYKKEKIKREAQCIANEQEQEADRQYARAMRNMRTSWENSKNQEGLDDISELLDDMDDDDMYSSVPLAADGRPASLVLLEQLVAEKRAAEAEYDF